MSDLSTLRGAHVLVTGWGVSGRALIRPLHDLGALVTVTDGGDRALAEAAELGLDTVAPDDLVAVGALDRFGLVVTSPGWRAESPVLAAAAAAGIPIWGDVEFSWRIDQAEIYGPVRRWLVVTGTNGKTTTTSMVQSILDAAQIPSAACGNIGLPVLDALTREPRTEVLAVELSSFQLHWAPSVHPTAGVVLNIAEDHLDWHGGMQPYVDAKARVLTGDVGVVGLDDPVAASLADTSRARRTVGFRLGTPTEGELGVLDGQLHDLAFTDEPGATLVGADEISPPGPAGIMDALAAAALGRAIGIDAPTIGAGLRNHTVGPHRASLVREVGGVGFVDDSKATNPHAARSSILAHPRVVWLAGGLLKGASVDELVAEVADRLVAAVLIGRDASQIADAVARHAPDVPVVMVPTGDDAGVTDVNSADSTMRDAVRTAATYAAPGDTVLLAPAAASLDMFASYGHRGASFAAAAGELTTADLSTRS